MWDGERETEGTGSLGMDSMAWKPTGYLFTPHNLQLERDVNICKTALSLALTSQYISQNETNSNFRKKLLNYNYPSAVMSVHDTASLKGEEGGGESGGRGGSVLLQLLASCSRTTFHKLAPLM